MITTTMRRVAPRPRPHRIRSRGSSAGRFGATGHGWEFAVHSRRIADIRNDEGGLTQRFALLFGFRRVHLVDLAVERAAADAELLCRISDVAIGRRERLHDEPLLGRVQIERTCLFVKGFSAREMPAGTGAPAACRTAAGRSRRPTLAPVAMTTPCSIAVRNSRTLPGQS